MALDPLYPDVALYGAPGVGKTTLRAFFVELGFVPVSFAGWHRGGLRDIVSRMGLNPNDRPTLNFVGMKMRVWDPDVWVNSGLAEIERVHLQLHAPVILDDLRGDNEWNALRAAGFVRIHLVVDNARREERLRLNGRQEGSDMKFLWLLEDTERYHPDYVVSTDGTITEAQQALTDILNIERGRRA